MSKTETEAKTPSDINLERVEIPIGAFSKGPRHRINATEDRVFKPHPVDTVVILGMGQSLFDWVHDCYGDAPIYAQPGVEIWSINYSGLVMHSNVCFNMHDLEDPSNLEHRKIFEAYALHKNLKVVSTKTYDWLPNSYEYPLQEIMEDPYASVPYFTNSTAYLIAMAIACRAKEIKIYGCDFDYDERFLAVNKFERGRANMEFWLGRASAYGAVLTIGRHSTLLAASTIQEAGRIPFYGYGNTQPQFELTEDHHPIMIGFDKPVPAAEEMLKAGSGPET